jgi:metallo-beta-lactamase class B
MRQQLTLSMAAVAMAAVVSVAPSGAVLGQAGQAGQVGQPGQVRPGTTAASDSIEAHVEAARAAAGKDFPGLFGQLCAPPAPRSPQGQARGGGSPPGQPPNPSLWHVEPVKVFDNLYFVGQSEYSAWAITTSAGIILLDSIFDYSVDDEVVGGLRKLGLDPAQIKIVVVSHGHADHSGGAKFLQDRFNAHVVLSAADWDLLDRSQGSKPKRDMVATDGQKITLGDETLTVYATPGHTLGTLSTLIPVTDHGQRHVVAAWGGTLFNWVQNRAAYITPDRPDKFWFDTYISSARRFRDVVAQAGADAIISNHTIYDESKTKIPALAARRPGDPNPYVVGAGAVQRYLTVAEECARAGELRAQRKAE